LWTSFQKGGGVSDPRRQSPDQTQQEWWRVAFASIGDAVITTDINGGITFLNPVAESLTGWTLAEAAGVPLIGVFNIVNEETRHAVENPAARALREGVVVGLANHTLLIAKDGTERPIDDSAAPIRNGQGEVVGVVLVFRDVTERRRAEKALQESEERFRLLVESVKDYAIFMMDPEGRVVSWNAGAERIKGYKDREIIGQHFSVFYTPEERQDRRPQMGLTTAKDEGTFEDEGWRVRKDGTRFQAHVVITPVYDEAGTHRGFAKITHDVSERRKWEQEHLREREASIRKDQFLAVLSHELRNPLTPIRNVLQVLTQQAASTPVLRQACEMMDRNVRVMTRLVDDLLDLSRIASGKVEIKRELVEVSVIMERGAETARPVVDAHRHHLTVTPPKDPMWVEGDPVWLGQVVMNLLTNAAKYTGEGGKIWLTAEREGDRATIRVRDTGIGIEPDKLPRVFEMFTQVDTSLNRTEGGLGVGLSIVKKIVELHGGAVEARSGGRGAGSEFVVRLPLRTAAPARMDQAEDAARAATRPLRVLVVDDNADAADSLAMFLKLYGHDVQAAHSGAAALNLVKTYSPQVIILDLSMPVMDGFQVAQRLRLNIDMSKVALIALTGLGQESDRRRTRDAGFNYHIVKPPDPQQLHELLTVLAEDHHKQGGRE
jgi:PAS domain S-box-containing protein